MEEPVLMAVAAIYDVLDLDATTSVQRQIGQFVW